MRYHSRAARAGLFLVALFSLSCLAQPVHASIIGHTLRIEWDFTPSGGVFTFTEAVVVDPGVEWNPGFGVDLVDVADGTIDIFNTTFGWSDPGLAGINGFRFIDIFGTIPDFTSFSLVSKGPCAPPIDPVFSVTPDAILVNFHPAGGTGSNIGPCAGTSYTLAFTTGEARVPQPTSVTLLGIGLAGLGLIGLIRRRRTLK